MSKTDIVVKPKIQVKTNVQPPSLFNVIYLNDSVTTMEFVIETLNLIEKREAYIIENRLIKAHDLAYISYGLALFVFTTYEGYKNEDSI